MRIQSLQRTSAAEVQAHTFDIQAILGSGFMPLRHCTFWLLHVDHRGCAREWLRRVLNGHFVKSVADLGRVSDAGVSGHRTRHRHDEVATIALSYAGLKALDIKVDEQFPFPTAFTMGMSSDERAALLGDENVSKWTWLDTTADAAHLLVAHYRSDAAPDYDGLFANEPWEDRGFRKISRVDSCPSYAERIPTLRGDDDDAWHAFEPFGFRDGVANPIVDGLRTLGHKDSTSGGPQDSLIAPGEFILGHVNEYGERAYCPDVEKWPQRTLPDGSLSRFGFNGSYLAVRQIRQKVEEFRIFDDANASSDNHTPSITELMIGRRKDGSSLVRCPQAPAAVDDFRYRTNDCEGFQCPRGSHIRRANPRDVLGWDSASGILASRLHRLLRRGRVYAKSSSDCGAIQASPPKAHRKECGDGLFFMALNGNLERQFELVHARWLQGTSFGDLSKESDPILGSGGSASFSIQSVPVGRKIDELPAFTELVGGGYFFVPSLSALRFIASL